jgi:hypothetical protein
VYFHLRSHIYGAQFRQEMILLDIRRDKYYICSPGLSEQLFELLDYTKIHSLSHEEDEQTLVTSAILEKKEKPYPYFIDRKPDSIGVSNVDWRLPLSNKKVKLNLKVFAAFMTLLKVHLTIRFLGFERGIRLIKNARKSRLNYIIPSIEALEDLVGILNKACLIYPKRTKCLEWAITFVLLSLKRHWKCNLEIGVQNYPFMAHAWVECDGKVVMDSQDLRERLGIILNEPFREVKTL